LRPPSGGLRTTARLIGGRPGGHHADDGRRCARLRAGSDPHQSDVLSKLARSGASERHAFILVPGFSIAPFGVVDMLWRGADDVVPTTAPNLPHQVTHVWLMAFWTVGSGLRWSPESGWERFERQFRIGDN
jgi:hypothetical protein